MRRPKSAAQRRLSAGTGEATPIESAPRLGFDTDSVTGQPFLQAMKAQGYSTAIRYYRNADDVSRLTVDEMLLLKSEGFAIVAVYQHLAKVNINQFSNDQGKAAATNAYKYATKVIRQPLDSAIYFAVDFNPGKGAIENSIIPYFKGVAETMASLAPDRTGYGIGVYGNGLTCKMLLEEQIVSYTWLSQSSEYYGTAEFAATGQWDMKQTLRQTPPKFRNFGFDPDLISTSDCGAFNDRVINLEDSKIPRTG